MISAKIKLEIMNHAQEEYPRECCGVVTQKGRVQKYHRIDNVHRDGIFALSDKSPPCAGFFVAVEWLQLNKRKRK